MEKAGRALPGSNSMMYSKQPITLEQVQQTLNSCDVRMHFEGDKSDEASGLFVRVRVCCHDGIVRTIKEVCHVADLKKNLISLAKLEDDLYTLAGSTIIGSVNASTVKLSNDDKAKL
ncbi:hypothetical protein KY290_034333 [Solanum tuberosum]|uniref:Retrovirus-related Pol polyprotein from transposon TNT 1-94-like beta-barrel domain-containing protein n=1 Tax=Solanum tuberosum TaxID=4113 RepID=A0ABQ7U6I8_SOLTU|nr:hypothetical protein KY284_033434 [Solanum tuberosum]KAH0741290.1 hypothetical protein KY290_034333 [Solanum tuberosum]